MARSRWILASDSLQYLVLAVGVLLLVSSLPGVVRNAPTVGGASTQLPGSSAGPLPASQPLPVPGSPLPNLTGAFDPITGASVPPNGSVAQGLGPAAVIYDPVTSSYLVANPTSAVLTVVSASTHRVTQNLQSALGEASNFTYDPADGLIFATVHQSLVAISAANYTVESYLAFSSVINAAVFVPGVDEVFVTQDGLPEPYSPNGMLVAVSAQPPLAVVGEVVVGQSPGGVTFSPATGLVYAAVSINNIVAEVDAASPDVVVASVPVGNGPTAIAYDPTPGAVVVADEFGNNLTVIDDSSPTSTWSIPVARAPITLAVDDAVGTLYVGYSGPSSANLTAVDLANDTSTPLPGLGGDLGGLAWDSADSVVLITHPAARLLVGYSPSTAAVVSMTVTGSSTTGIIYVPDDGGELFVAEPSAMVVAVLSVAPEQVVSTIYLGSEPGAMVYDPETDQVFVTTFGNLTVIAAGSRTVVGTIPLPWPATNLTYDSVGHAILAASVDGTALYIVSDATDSVTKTIGIGGGVTGVAFDPASDVAFVAYESVPASAAVEAISLTTDTVLSDVAVGPSPSTPGPILYDPGSNLVFEAAHPLYFGPQLVEISASTGRVLGSTATPSNLTSLAVDPTTAEVVGTGFSAFGGILAVVPTMVGAFVQNVSAGEDPLDVAFDPGTGQLFVTQGWVGEIVCLRYPAGAYSLDIATAGLPIGKAWTIVLGGTVENESAAAVAFSVVNGTLPYIFVGPSGYRIHGIPPSGALDVAGASVGLAFSFARGSTATVVFKGVDFGGLYWCAYLLWETCTNTTSIAFDNLTPASYAYSIGQLIGFRETVHLSGRAVGLGGTVHATTTSTFTVRFSLLLAVRFTEIGLPIGTSWGVRVAGQIYATTALGFFVNLTNGSYGIKVLAPAGFTGHALPSVLRVNNDTPIVWIEFARVPAR